MKIIATVLIVFCYSVGYSQNFKYFQTDRTIDWTKWAKKTVNDNIIKANYNNFKDLPYQNVDQLTNNKDLFHLIDVDKDGVPELIYNGYNGGEGEMIVVYKKQQEKYLEVQRFYGQIKDIESNTEGRMRFIVFEPSCCGGYIDYIETFVYNPQLKQFTVTNSVAKIDETVMPKTFMPPQKFEIENSYYNLRFSPDILSGLQEGWYDFKPIKGQNIIATYQAGDEGDAYADSTDSTGRVWWFVIMNKEPNSGETLFYQGRNSDKNYKLIGWISSRYVKRIDE